MYAASENGCHYALEMALVWLTGECEDVASYLAGRDPDTGVPGFLQLASTHGMLPHDNKVDMGNRQWLVASQIL